ncbi:hypothetical protein [Devosia psychrophila]|uniref:Uncharacterized protein n=1 Tax=Devosia psychrophila TaxID=728005 RepID=A0A0F5Q1U3_9HYPH|nr:hypothetical protein [Devosia psychrophila]KKC34845.1 hypothetical protein WH91_01055 [Devosia psychrophila]SFC10353.1 hypothetical protein SAMN04488059_102142 [Devosia psychrophila]
MEYTEQILDRSTGELVTVSQGDWVTISELGDLYGVGHRTVRVILRAMNFLHVEGGGSHQRHRLSSWVTDQGWGKRMTPRHGPPFDVVGPEGQRWIVERWQATSDQVDADRSQPSVVAGVALAQFAEDRDRYRRLVGRKLMALEEKVSWLIDHFPALSQSEMASVLAVTQQLVSRYMNARAKQLRDLREVKSREVFG